MVRHFMDSGAHRADTRGRRRAAGQLKGGCPPPASPAPGEVPFIKVKMHLFSWQTELFSIKSFSNDSSDKIC